MGKPHLDFSEIPADAALTEFDAFWKLALLLQAQDVLRRKGDHQAQFFSCDQARKCGTHTNLMCLLLTLDGNIFARSTFDKMYIGTVFKYPNIISLLVRYLLGKCDLPLLEFGRAAEHSAGGFVAGWPRRLDRFAD